MQYQIASSALNFLVLISLDLINGTPVASAVNKAAQISGEHLSRHSSKRCIRHPGLSVDYEGRTKATRGTYMPLTRALKNFDALCTDIGNLPEGRPKVALSCCYTEIFMGCLPLISPPAPPAPPFRWENMLTIIKAFFSVGRKDKIPHDWLQRKKFCGPHAGTKPHRDLRSRSTDFFPSIPGPSSLPMAQQFFKEAFYCLTAELNVLLSGAEKADTMGHLATGVAHNIQSTISHAINTAVATTRGTAKLLPVLIQTCFNLFCTVFNGHKLQDEVIKQIAANVLHIDIQNCIDSHSCVATHPHHTKANFDFVNLIRAGK